jgi:AcrR family transcriptional regulator
MDTGKSTPVRIIEAATMLFWRHGYHAVSTDAICRAAAINKGSLYHAFESKAKILETALEAIWRRNSAEIAAIYARPEPIDARLRDHLGWYARSQRALAEQFGMVVGQFDMALGVDLPDEIRTVMTEHRRDYLVRISDAIAEIFCLASSDRARAEWMAATLRAFIGGLMAQARAENSLVGLDILQDTGWTLLAALDAGAGKPR